MFVARTIAAFLVLNGFASAFFANQIPADDQNRSSTRLYRIDEFSILDETSGPIDSETITKNFERLAADGVIKIHRSVWISHQDGTQSSIELKSSPASPTDAFRTVAKSVFDDEVLDSKTVVFFVSKAIGQVVHYQMRYESIRLIPDGEGAFRKAKNTFSFTGDIVPGDRKLVAGASGPSAAMLLLSVVHDKN
jgi:hypothetical protein